MSEAKQQEERGPGWILRLLGAEISSDKGERNGKQQKETRKTGFMEVLKHWPIPKLKDDLDYGDLKLEWPVWHRELERLFKVLKPEGREWSEDEKYWILLRLGGKHVREVDLFTSPVSGETGEGEDDEPLYSNLVKRLNWSFCARDSATEISLLQRKKLGPDESARKFLDELKRQISLSGLTTQERKDTELRVALMTSMIDSDKILKRSIGTTVEQLEARALIQEEIHSKKGRQEERVHEMKREQGTVSKRIKLEPGAGKRDVPKWCRDQRPKGEDCRRCGRRGGHGEGYTCPAINDKCFVCEEKGHRAAMCQRGRKKRSETSATAKHSN